jgi:hypothetical protein
MIHASHARQHEGNLTDTLLIALISITALAGVLALVRGLYGVAIDDHPLCRRCGFDLTGRPKGVNICSECGADLTRPHAIRIGHRRRRGGLLSVGVSLLALVLLVGGGVGWIAMSTANWRQYAPVWFLLREANGLDPVSRDAAITELASRLSSATLAQGDIDLMVDQTLALQADLNRQWIPAWGDLVETAQASGKLSAARWQKYLIQAPNLRLEVRPDVRRGDRVPYWIHSGKSRVGSRSAFYATFKEGGWKVGSVARNDVGGVTSGTRLEVNGSGSSGSSLDLDKFLDQVADGPQTITRMMEIGISGSSNWNAPAVATSKLELTTSFTLHPATQPTVTINHNPAFRAGVEKALTCTEVGSSKGWGPNAHADCTISVNHLPVGVGYDVFAMVNGKEYKISSFAAPSNGRFGGYGSMGELPFNTPEKVDLILKPSTDAALGTVDTFEIWDGQIVIKNVPVKGPATQPATQPATKPTSQAMKSE